MKKLFGTDGIRGIAEKDLTEEFVKKLGGALVYVMKDSQNLRPKILVGMDTRLSSPSIAESLADGIMSAGGNVFTVGICSTPAVAYLTQKKKFSAGVMISASHNPYFYNGIKIFGGDGFKISDETEEKIELILQRSENKTDTATGTKQDISEGVDEYINYLADSFPTSLSGLKIGIDCANGSASVSAERLFSSLGAECHIISSAPNGININEGCGSTDLSKLRALVKEENLHMGIAFDGDADRCLAVDENGCEVDGDSIMAILALWLKEENLLLHNTLVATVMSNIGLKKFCEENDINYISTSVGDRYVIERINEGGFSLGGEQSGHIILRSRATTGDGQLTALALLSVIKKSGKSLSALAAVMRKYPQYLTSVEACDKEKYILLTSERISSIINNAEKRILPYGRLLVRPSGTEPIIRIMAEGEDFNLIKEVSEDLKEEIKAELLASEGAV